MSSLRNRLKGLGRGGLLVLLIGLLLTIIGLSPKQAERVLSNLTDTQLGLYSVQQVLDGDTIIVNMNGQAETIRFIGLDTPEKNHPEKPVQCFAEAASAHLAELINFQSVRLQADPLSQNRDRYNRLLRYVYLPDDTLLNARQIADGFGFAYVNFPFSRSDEFQRLEAEARTAGRGLWQACEVYLENGYINTDPASP